MACLKKREGTLQIQWCEGGRQRRRSLDTESLQIAKERLMQFESAQLRGGVLPLPTKTPIGEVVAAFIEHMGNSPDICRRHYAALTHDQLTASVEFVALAITRPSIPRACCRPAHRSERCAGCSPT